MLIKIKTKKFKKRRKDRNKKINQLQSRLPRYNSLIYKENKQKN